MWWEWAALTVWLAGVALFAAAFVLAVRSQPLLSVAMAVVPRAVLLFVALMCLVWPATVLATLLVEHTERRNDT